MPSRNKNKGKQGKKTRYVLFNLFSIRDLNLLLGETSTQEDCPSHSIISIIIVHVY